MGGEYANHENKEKCRKASDEKEAFCDRDVAVSTILQCTLKKHEGVVWSEHIRLTTRTSADSGENSNVPSESTKRGKFIDYNLAYQHLKKYASPWNALPISRTVFSGQSYEIMVQLQNVDNLETNVMIVARNKI